MSATSLIIREHFHTSNKDVFRMFMVVRSFKDRNFHILNQGYRIMHFHVVKLGASYQLKSKNKLLKLSTNIIMPLQHN